MSNEIVIAKHNIDQEPNTPTKYGIRGIADLLFYNADGSITIEDIKSHNDMYDAFIHRSAHVAQGNTYAILAEEVYGKPVKQFQIFYSMDVIFLNKN